MFNIFRRSKNKTQPNINHPKSQRLTNTDKLASPNAENHQPLSEDERDYVRREVLPTARVELDNLRGNAFEAAERSDNGNTEKEWREREKKLSAGAVAGAAASASASASASAKYVRNPTQDNHRRQHKNVDNFYFDERVNLAKTVPNFTANDTPAVVAACSANKQIITNSAAIGDDGLSRLAISKELRNTAESSNSSRNEFEEQQRRVRTAGHKTNSFSNNNKKKDKQHFHRTKDEEYEYDTEYVEPVNEKVATAAAIVAPSTNDLVRYRKSKKSSRNADNVCKRQSWLGLTLSNVRHRNKEEAVEADKNKTPTDERKAEEAPVRKSFFLSYSKSIDSDKQLSAIRNPRAPANAKRPRSKFFNSDTTTTATTNETRANSGERTKLEWSRDFLSEILMARGRNHKRQHNQQKKHQQQQQAEQHRQQQQQQEKQHRLQHVKQSPSNDLTSSSCSSPSSPAITDVDNHQPVIKICDDPKLRNSTHLETILDPAGNASTNNCQTTESKNNHKNSNSQSVRISSNSVKRVNGKPESESESVTQSPPAAAATAPSKEPRQMGATSPEHVNELSTNQTLVTSATTTTSTSTSTSTSHSTTTESESTIDCCNCAEAIVSPHEQILAVAELGATLSPLNRLTTAEQQITDTPNIKRNVFLADPTTHTAEVKIATTNNDSEHLGNSSGTLKATKSQLNELTECDRDYREVLLQRGQTDGNQATLPLGEMGQSNVKPEARASPSRREFRETALVDDAAPVALNSSPSEPRVVVVPTITVVDYSDGDSGDGSPVAQDVFYDFDSEPCKNADAQNGRKNVLIEGEERQRASVEEGGLSICVVDDALEDDNVFHAADGVNEWQFIHSEPLRLHNHTPLTEVLEEEEEEEEVEDEDDENVDEKVEMSMSSGFIKTACDPEHVRHHLASTNSNDSNLSSSFYDSGIGSDAFSTHADSPAKLQTLDTCCDLLNERFTEASKASNWNVRQSPSRSTPTTSRRLPFVRDGNSTQCDPTLMQCDDFDFVAETGEQVLLLPNERLVCIESISLPDVVVESTATTNNNNNNSNSNSHCNSLASVASTSSGSEHVIHINGATGNSMSNVHFVPIHVETGDVAGERQKRRSLDDSVIGGKKVFDHLNVHQVARTTIKITAEEDEDASVAQRDGEAKCFFQEDSHITEKLKRDLVNQESRFNAQLEDAQNNTYNLERKVNELQTHIESLEKDLALKTWNVERLQGELVAAHKDDEYVRKRLKLLEDEKTNLRHKYSDNEEEFNRKYAELEQKYRELEEKFKETCHLASELHTQLAAAQSEVEECREEMEKLRIEMQEQLRMLRNALENSEADRKISEDKWQKEFEMLRTHNQDREESLMTDCEWQLRQMQRVCKEKVDKAEYGRREAREHADILESAAQERLQELQLLRTCADEAKSLRGLASEQEISLQSLAEQIESLKADLKTANENLEEQIEAVRKIKYQCDNKIYDKERELIQRIDEVRNEAASFWENKLYTEMTRLKSELESVFIDERRDALDKLQAEHIEELRALTTRYTANEEELRAELTELQERLDLKNSEFLDLREKSDSALLQTRMHLDRADREYQNAMFREEARREALEESLRKEFENEKLEMEEKFRERLGQVKDEFARELQMSTQDMKEQHTMELEQQKLKLFAEKDEALQELTERHRKKLANAENQMKDIELRHQRDLKDLKATYDAEKLALDKRDISNANEIEQLHRKCRCLTNLFEEMRMRYERRDPRQEDLREIDELRRRCESQERDLYLLTDRLREMQMQMEELQQNGDGSTRKAVKKPQPKAIPTNCDVIYEENEERDSTPPPPPEATAVISLKNSEEQKLLAESCEREGSLAAEVIARPMKKTKINGQKYNNNNNKNNSHNNINNSSKSRNNNNIKCGDRINGDDDDDDGHMITAM